VADSAVRIGLVLPDVMGTYGDGGNAVVLRQRLLLRGFDASIVEITLSDPVPASLDIYTLGGAEDYAQRLATKHLLRYPGLQQAVSRRRGRAAGSRHGTAIGAHDRRARQPAAAGRAF
jgi:CobQ-like glutamine amidotransferase family enzyme